MRNQNEHGVLVRCGWTLCTSDNRRKRERKTKETRRQKQFGVCVLCLYARVYIYARPHRGKKRAPFWLQSHSSGSLASLLAYIYIYTRYSTYLSIYRHTHTHTPCNIYWNTWRDSCETCAAVCTWHSGGTEMKAAEMKKKKTHTRIRIENFELNVGYFSSFCPKCTLQFSECEVCLCLQFCVFFSFCNAVFLRLRRIESHRCKHVNINANANVWFQPEPANVQTNDTRRWWIAFNIQPKNRNECISVCVRDEVEWRRCNEEIHRPCVVCVCVCAHVARWCDAAATLTRKAYGHKTGRMASKFNSMWCDAALFEFSSLASKSIFSIHLATVAAVQYQRLVSRIIRINIYIKYAIVVSALHLCPRESQSIKHRNHQQQQKRKNIKYCLGAHKLSFVLCLMQNAILHTEQQPQPAKKKTNNNSQSRLKMGREYILEEENRDAMEYEKINKKKN